MKLKTFQYIQGKGWSVNEFPKLDSKQTLVLIFAAPNFIHNTQPLKELSDAYSNSIIIGCSSAGEIAGTIINDNSISVAVVQFEKTPLQSTIIQIDSMDHSYDTGAKIANDLNRDDLTGIFILSDGLRINGSELVRGLNSLNKKDVVITGGLAGDGSDFKNTWTIYKGEVISGKAIAVGFYGKAIQMGHGSRGGWDIFGPERLITASNHNVLYELDGKPALELYKTYLGEKASGLPATGLLFPLAIRKNAEDSKHLVRTILSIDEASQSLTFAGDVPTGYLAQLMRANFDRLINAANEASKLTLDNMTLNTKSPLLLIAISCVGRRLLLGELTEEETESTLEIFPAGTQQIGFYSYGEISPFTTGSCDLHNQTMTLTAIQED